MKNLRKKGRDFCPPAFVKTLVAWIRIKCLQGGQFFFVLLDKWPLIIFNLPPLYIFQTSTAKKSPYLRTLMWLLPGTKYFLEEGTLKSRNKSLPILQKKTCLCGSGRLFLR